MLESTPLDTLAERLRAADPAAPGRIDLNNKRRVIRAIEIVEGSGLPLAAFRSRPATSAKGVLLLRDREELHRRIEANIRAMFAHGVVDEVRLLPPPSPTVAKAIGLADIQRLIRGEITTSDCINRIVIATRQFAKRQLTWFRNQSNFTPLNLTGITDPNRALHEALSVLTSGAE